ncbi:MAG: hypothetical protein GC161_04995 [Planctomycetaceae bacterium]|nr:hypothetical protein [Planctomycetaceae bacterium]
MRTTDTLRRRLTLIGSALALSLAACGGGEGTPEQSLKAGYEALGAGDGAKALPLLERAAAGLAASPSDPRWKEIQVALVEAQAHVNAEAARDRFLTLARANRTAFESRDFASVGNKLFAKDPSISLDVVNAGLKEFGYESDARLHGLIEDIKQRAASSGDSALSSKLAGLGYLGG